MIKIFVDTDVLIDHSKSKSDLLIYLLKKQTEQKAELFINAAVITEFVTDKSLDNAVNFKKAEDLLKFFTVISLDQKVGYKAGEIKRKKTTEFLGDALVAATCLIHDLQLATRNIKHFKKIKDLKFYKRN